MSNLLDLISPFLIGFLMAFSGYGVILIGEITKKLIIIPLIAMLLFDTMIVTMYVFLGTTKLQLMTGIMFGTIFKVIVFLLHHRHFRDENQ